MQSDGVSSLMGALPALGAPELSRLQQNYYHKHRNQADNKRRDGAQCQAKLTLVLWDHQWRKVQRLRNQDIYGQDEAARARAERACPCLRCCGKYTISDSIWNPKSKRYCIGTKMSTFAGHCQRLKTGLLSIFLLSVAVCTSR